MANPNHHAGEEIRVTNVSPEMKTQLKELAKKSGFTLSHYIKKQLRIILEQKKQ